MTAPATDRSPTTEPSWRRALRHVVLQEPLIYSRLSLANLRAPSRPRGILVGIGLCARERLGQAVPIDVLGMLLPAEIVRRAIGEPPMLVLVADRHASENGLDADRIRERTAETVRTLAQVRNALGLRGMTIVRASSFHDSAAYQAVLADVRERAPSGADGYVLRQVADVLFLERRYGALLKVGWAGGGSDGAPGEPFFDDRCRRWGRSRASFVYCKAGRVLDDWRRKAAPYVALEPSRRICLDPDEDVDGKLHNAPVARSTKRALRNHLRAIAYSYSRHVRPLHGPLEERVRTIIDDIVHGRPVRPD
jgi:hypothetical protein